MRSLLAALGHQVRVVYDAKIASEAAREFVPDLVPIDIRMPGMDGYKVTQSIRREANLPGVILAALTGLGADLDPNKAREAGFDHYLLKPVNIEALEKMLADLERAR